MQTVENVYRPLAAEIAKRAASMDRALIVGVNGAQGTGKSTLTRFLSFLLEIEYNQSTASFSLDDIYLTRLQRNELAMMVHPMLAVRGVPGTHDIELGMKVIRELEEAGPEATTLIPSFDKAVDDRAPQERWTRFIGKPAVIIVEGWCAGSTPERPKALEKPLNDLEREEDSKGVWRRYVNGQLETSYRDFFALFDILVFIPVPQWELVYEWRLLQEQKLKERCKSQGLDDSAVMSPEQVRRFVQYYERVTRRSLEEMAERADYVLVMDEEHRIQSVSGLKETA